ncbi:MAG: chitobiase/beta-hexosaminidase C-terminal domain-containing protein [Muribaculaceae bacterium]|nr:chitobiase/beta-hexosaminidase C-terminal domain-containing protein [Muribaculaceae bacterium]
MRILKSLLPLLVLLLWSTTAKAQYNPTDPPEPGVNFTLTTRCVPANAGYSMSGAGTYAFGRNVNVSVSTTTGYRFTGWEDDEGTIVSTTSSFTYVMPTKNVNLIARFVYDPTSPAEPSTPEFKNVSYISFQMNPAEGGSLYANYTGEYEVGSTQRFSVRTNSNYRFVNWTRNGIEIGTSTTLDFTVPLGDQTLVANFAYDPTSPAEPSVPSIPHNLTLRANPEGAASLSGAGEHLAGSSFTVSARANTYYHFVNWTDEEGNVVAETSQFSYTMPDRHVTLTANYTYNYDPTSPGEPGTPNPDSGMAENMVLWPRFGMYDDTHVQILCETPGSTIHYTLDGSTPNASSPIYTEPVYVEKNLLVRAIAYKEGMEDSPVVSYQVTAYHASAPKFIMEKRLITITSDTPDAIIHYTLDFSNPNEESEVYSSPFEPEENCRIKAYARKEGLTDSKISVFVYRRADYVIPAPTFSLDDEQRLTITPGISGGSTYFTTDGNDPDENSNLYTGPIELEGHGIIKAYTVHPDYFDSPVAEYTYSIENVEAPLLTPMYRERIIGIDHPLSYDVIVTIDGEEQRLSTPAEIEVVPGMLRLNAVAIADYNETLRSEPVEMPIVFHRAPKLDYDGHAVHYGPADDEPEADRAEASLFMDGVYRHGGIGKREYEVTYMAHLTAIMKSDNAFRSDTIAIDIDYFNTGRRAAARNGHRLSEGFGTWGDRLEDYTYLQINGGEIEKEDLQFLGSLPNLTTLDLQPTFPTSDPCDSVFAGSRIETLSLWFANEGMLKGMERLTTVMWGITNEAMPNGRLTEAGNPNILLWVFAADKAPADAVNVVVHPYIGGFVPTDPDGQGIRGSAEQIILQAGYPFRAHMPIDVKAIQLTKEFSMPTRIGECAGWESIVLPFAPEGIIHENGDELVPINAWTGPADEKKPFWLYHAGGDGWEASDSISSLVPYIISMPNSEEYVEGYSIPGKVTFAAVETTLNPIEPTSMSMDWKDGIVFVGTFMPVEEQGIRSLNVNVAAGRDWLGSAFVDEDDTLPFGAYMYGSNLPSQIPVFGDWSGVMTPTSDINYGIMVETPAPGAIRVSAMRDCHADIVTPDGSVIRSFSVKAGENVTTEDLTRGLYICAGVKVMVK